MTNESSVKYISSLLRNPSSINEGDQSSISLFRQTFPYFVPMRYVVALDAHRKSPFSPQMMSAIMPYMGDWILFCEFLNGGSKPATVQDVTVQAEPVSKIAEDTLAESRRLREEITKVRSDAPPAVVADEHSIQKEASPTPARVSLEEELQSLAPVIAVVEDGVASVPLAVTPEESMAAEPAHEPAAAQEEAMVAASAAPVGEETVPPVLEEPFVVPAPVVVEQPQEPVFTVSVPVEAETIAVASEPHADTARSHTFIAPSPVIIEQEPEEAPAAAAEDAVSAQPMGEHSYDVPIPSKVIIPEEDKVDAESQPGSERFFMDQIIETPHEKAIDDISEAALYLEPEETVPVEATETGSHEEETPQPEILPADDIRPQVEEEEVLAGAEPAEEPVYVTMDAGQIDGLAEAVEIVNEEPAFSHEPDDQDPLIFPIYTKDYFLQQGERVSDEIPLEINELKSGSLDDKDKSLMVVMSFAEWLLHFKSSSERQMEETRDQKALKTMWQKEKLAAAIEEENEEIPETVFAMAVNSITKEEGLASETLAEVYMKQGKYDKAIEMYRKLSLKNPQKNAYFAAKIDEALKDKES